jgi:hypothetical protein
MYFQTGQVIFVPKWPKGEFVSILDSFCVWTKSLICKDVANWDSTVRSEVRRISKFPVSRSDDVSSCRTSICLLFHPSGRRVFPSGRQTDKHHLSGRRVSSVRTPTSYREASVTACSVRTFQQHVRMFQQHVRTPISSRMVL